MSKTADNTPPLTPSGKKTNASDDFVATDQNEIILNEPMNAVIKRDALPATTNILNAPKKDRTKKPKKPRCAFEGCRKKLRITDTKCRCDKIFCHIHRCAVDHKCAKLHEKDDHETHSKRCGLGGGAFSKLDRI